MNRALIMALLSASTLAHADGARCKDELVGGVVRRVDRDMLVIALGTEEATLIKPEQVPGERYRVGDAIVAYCTQSGTLSRASTHLVTVLFAREVPEIGTGVVRIENTVREPGVRTKIAVSSTDPAVDPIEACVGPKGARVKAVVQGLHGETIDLVPYDADAARYVTAALAPAEIKRIIIDPFDHRMELVIPDGTLAAAIGKNGVKLRLAAQLTGWKLDVYLASTYAAAVRKAKQQVAAVLGVAGVKTDLAEAVYTRGWRTAADLSRAKVDELVKEIGVDEVAAGKIIAAAQAAAAKADPAKKP